MNNNKSLNCRLCEEKANLVFSKKILNKFIVNYYKCSNYESLQTEKPLLAR